MPLKLSLLVGALCASTGLLVSACYDTGTEHPLRWNVRFLCDSDRADSDRLHLVLHQGGCDGAPVYDQLLAPGDAPEAAPPLTAGAYGFEAVALAHGGMVAQACTAQHLPTPSSQVTIVLASTHCDGVHDSGTMIDDTSDTNDAGRWGLERSRWERVRSPSPRLMGRPQHRLSRPQ